MFSRDLCFIHHLKGISMKKNMGATDKAIRVIAAIAIIILYLTNIISGTLAVVLLIVAAVFVLTSFFSFCPLYLLFGISTRKKHGTGV